MFVCGGSEMEMIIEKDRYDIGLLWFRKSLSFISISNYSLHILVIRGKFLYLRLLLFEL